MIIQQTCGSRALVAVRRWSSPRAGLPGDKLWGHSSCEEDCHRCDLDCFDLLYSILLMLKEIIFNEKLCSDEDTFPVFCIFFVFSVCHYGILKSDTTLCRCGEIITRRKSLNFHDFFHLTVGQSIIACLQRRKGHQGCRNDSGRKRDWCRRWKLWNFEKFLCAF